MIGHRVDCTLEMFVPLVMTSRNYPLRPPLKPGQLYDPYKQTMVFLGYVVRCDWTLFYKFEKSEYVIKYEKNTYYLLKQLLYYGKHIILFGALLTIKTAPSSVNIHYTGWRRHLFLFLFFLSSSNNKVFIKLMCFLLYLCSKLFSIHLDIFRWEYLSSKIDFIYFFNASFILIRSVEGDPISYKLPPACCEVTDEMWARPQHIHVSPYQRGIKKSLQGL